MCHCLDAVWTLSGRCLDAVWTLSGQAQDCLDRCGSSTNQVVPIYVTTNLEAERPVEDVPYDGFRDAMRLAAKRYGEFSIDKDPTGRLLSTKLATKSGR